MIHVRPCFGIRVLVAFFLTFLAGCLCDTVDDMSNTSFQPGGQRIPDATRVATDQRTVFGDGSSENPLHTTGGGTREVFADHAPIDIGTPVCLGDSLSTEATLRGAQANSLSTAAPNAFAFGLVVESPETGTGDVVVQTSGPVTLTPDEWNNITGSPTLVPGEVYYLSPAASALTDTRPSTSGQYVTVLGYAKNRTTLILQPSAPLPIP